MNQTTGQETKDLKDLTKPIAFTLEVRSRELAPGGCPPTQKLQTVSPPRAGHHVGLVPSAQLEKLDFHLQRRSDSSGSAYLPGDTHPATCCPSIYHNFLFPFPG